MKLESVLEVGVLRGCRTIGECIDNVKKFAWLFFSEDEASQEFNLKEIELDLKALQSCEGCEHIDRKTDAQETLWHINYLNGYTKRAMDRYVRNFAIKQFSI